MSDDTRLTLCPDVILRRMPDGAWLFSNPRVHKHVEVDPDAARAIMAVAASGGSRETWVRALSTVPVRPRTAFTNAEGLLANPSGVASVAGAPVSGAKAIDELRTAWIVCEDGARDYLAYLEPRRSLLDTQHLGTFHQNVGRHIMVDLRLKQTWRWWHDQKFQPDGLALKPGPYAFVQGYFFDIYFGALDLRGLRLLDFACGNGFYSRRFRERGAEVVGIDTSPELIEIARRNHGDTVQFLQPIDAAACDAQLDELPAASFDRAYLSDALLFFFHDPRNSRSDERNSRSDDTAARLLLRRFRRLLKPDGVLYLMEPNGTFWLAGHAGWAERPFAFVTEYRHQVYHVAPTSDRVISALGGSGFVVADLIHPSPDPAIESSNSPMAAYARQFPLWDFYVCPAATVPV